MKLIPLLILATAFLSAAPVIHAQSDHPATDGAVAATVETQKKNPFRGTISGVNPSAGTFTITNTEKKVKTYTVSKEMPLTREDKPIAVADLKVGDYVRGSCLKSDEGKYQVFSGKIGKKTPEEEKAWAKEKAEKAAKAEKDAKTEKAPKEPTE